MSSLVDISTLFKETLHFINSTCNHNKYLDLHLDLLDGSRQESAEVMKDEVEQDFRITVGLTGTKIMNHYSS